MFRPITIAAVLGVILCNAAESQREPKLGDEYLRWQATRFATRLADESSARSAPCGDHDLDEPSCARRRWA
jgi:hypothetical protein